MQYAVCNGFKSVAALACKKSFFERKIQTEKSICSIDVVAKLHGIVLQNECVKRPNGWANGSSQKLYSTEIVLQERNHAR